MFPDLKSLDFAKVTEDEKDSARLQIIVSKNSLGKSSGGGDHSHHHQRREGRQRGVSRDHRGNGRGNSKEREFKKYSL